MNKCVLYIPSTGMTSRMVEYGYVDALRRLGWKVYVHDPRTKQGCRKFIEEYGVRLIITDTSCGLQHLSVEAINSNNVNVVVDIFGATTEDVSALCQIKACLLHTRIQPSGFAKYLPGWVYSVARLIHVPLAGNILRALPTTYDKITDVAMVANFGDDKETMTEIVSPLFSRLRDTNCPYQVFGDHSWEQNGIASNGPILDGPERVAHIYGTAGVCPNLHTTEQRESLAYLNDRAFTIQLCGGLQVVDSELATEYFGNNVIVATTPTRFINETLDAINSGDRISEMLDRVRNAAENHTYFHRLASIFLELGMLADADEAIAAGHVLAEKHCSQVQTMLEGIESYA